VPGEEIVYFTPQVAATDQGGKCSFRSGYGHTRWGDTQGMLTLFAPRFVPIHMLLGGCGMTSEFVLDPGLTAQTKLRAPPGIEVGQTLDGTVYVSIDSHGIAGRLGIGRFPLGLRWREDPDGQHRVEFGLPGFARKDTTALLAFPGFDPIEIGPSLQDEMLLRPSRRLELRVCDWDTGEPIEGIHPSLNYGALDERGFFTPEPKYDFTHFDARQQRSQRLAELEGIPILLRSDELLMPGESAAQITNLPHADYYPKIYLARHGEASPGPITILGPEYGNGACTLYLKRVH
ncbi:MAG: hypothetical protein ABI054_11875, partial [Planctomycetota bacterium]